MYSYFHSERKFAMKQVKELYDFAQTLYDFEEITEKEFEQLQAYAIETILDLSGGKAVKWEKL